MTNMLESIDASTEYIQSIISSKSSRMNVILNNISTDALKDLVRLLSEFKTVFALVQASTRPSFTYDSYLC